LGVLLIGEGGWLLNEYDIVGKPILICASTAAAAYRNQHEQKTMNE